MDSKLMISVLRGASNGAELLQRLEALTGRAESPEPAPSAAYGTGQPTLEPVAF